MIEQRIALESPALAQIKWLFDKKQMTQVVPLKFASIRDAYESRKSCVKSKASETFKSLFSFSVLIHLSPSFVTSSSVLGPKPDRLPESGGKKPYFPPFPGFSLIYILPDYNDISCFVLPLIKPLRIIGRFSLTN